jgi:endonuclease YncB( thermonuclease family)
MPTTRRSKWRRGALLGTKWRRSALLVGCGVAAWGAVVVGAARAQSLDMGSSPATQPAATQQSGGLDMDVNPTAPVAAPVAKSPIQALTSGANVQDGIVQVNPTASSEQTTTQVQPTPPAPATTATPATTGAPTTTAAPAPGQTTTAAPATAPVQTTTLTQPADGSPSSTAGATPPAAEPVSLDHPTVVDTANLKAGDTSVTLFGIDGVQGEAAQNLQGFLGATGNHVTCQAQTSADFVCLLPDGTDLAQAALINGAARVKADAPDAYREHEAAAQAARRGIWAGLPPPPATVTHPTVRDTATLVADNQTYVLDGLQGLGAPYAGQMQSYIAANGDSATCSPQDAPGHYICVLGDGTDIAKVALVNGGAVVAAGAPDSYRAQQLEALTNHRGIWMNPPPNLLLASAAAPPPVEFALVAGDDGADGITYVGGVPEAVIDGAAVFLIFGGDIGWGYYDHWHHWRDAPGRYRAHMERFHPGGHGLRGYHDEATLHREGVHPEAGHGDAAHGGVHPGETHTAGLAGHPGVASGAQPGVAAGAAAHPGVAGGTAHPGVAGGTHPGAAGGAAHLGVAGGGHSLVAPGARPGLASGAHSGTAGGGGFVHPGPSAAGFHPGGGAAPVAHASSGGGGGAVKKK